MEPAGNREKEGVSLWGLWDRTEREFGERGVLCGVGKMGVCRLGLKGALGGGGADTLVQNYSAFFLVVSQAGRCLSGFWGMGVRLGGGSRETPLGKKGPESWGKALERRRVCKLFPELGLGRARGGLAASWSGTFLQGETTQGEGEGLGLGVQGTLGRPMGRGLGGLHGQKKKKKGGGRVPRLVGGFGGGHSSVWGFSGKLLGKAFLGGRGSKEKLCQSFGCRAL